MYKKEYLIKSYELSCTNTLKEHVLLNFLQDIASEHADVLGFGTKFIQEHGLTWFLLKYNIKFVKPIQNIDKIYITTWSRGIERLWCNRDFEVYDENNSLLAVATSAWALIDLSTRKLTRPDKYLSNFPHEIKNVLPMFSDKHSVDSMIPFNSKDFVPCFDNIDVNMHVNNSVYFLWAEELLPFEFRKNKSVNQLELCYKKEVKYDDVVVAEAYTSDDFKTTVHVVRLKETNEVCFSLKIYWD